MSAVERDLPVGATATDHPAISAAAIHAPSVPLSIGVTGHRDLVPEELPQIRCALETLFRRVRDCDPSVRPALLTSMAEGADLLAAEVAEELGFSIVCVLPASATEARARLDSEQARHTFDRIYARADRLEIGCLVAASDDSSSAGSSGSEEPYQRAGAIIAGLSALLVAIWDGQETDLPGGTAWIVDYRRRGIKSPNMSMPIAQGGLLTTRDNDLVYEIRCSRRSHAQQTSLAAGVEDLGFQGTGVVDPRIWPSSFQTAVEHIAGLNRDAARFSAEIDRDGQRLSLPQFDPHPAHLEQLERLFRAVDWLGQHHHRRYRRALWIRYALWGAVAFLLLSFKFDSEGSWSGVLISLVLLLFAAGAVFASWAHRQSWHRKYIDYRALAEGLRVQYYWELAGIQWHSDGEFAHEAFLQRQDRELTWIRMTMRVTALQLATGRRSPSAGGLAEALGGWVGSDDRCQGGQLNYYRRGIDHLARRVRRDRMVEGGVLIVGLALAGLFFVAWALKNHIPPLARPVRESMLRLLALVPAGAAIFDNYVTQKADRALLRQYRHMYSLFTIADRELRLAASPEGQRRILLSLGHACLAEHAQWVLEYRDKRVEGVRW